MSDLPSEMQSRYSSSLTRYPAVGSCLSNASNPASFAWTEFRALEDMEVCLSHLHSSLQNFDTSVAWFEDQGFKVTDGAYERSAGTYRTIRAQWQIPQSGPLAGAKTPLTGLRAWLRSRESIGGLSIGLDFDPSGQVIDVSSGHSRK